jgi:uncharacterized protein (TIGR03437 family)
MGYRGTFGPPGRITFRVLVATLWYPIKFWRHLRLRMLKSTALVLLLIAALSATLSAQTFDNTGNGMLNGKYYFREVIYTSNDEAAVYGNITFSGGSYTISGAQILDANQQSVSPYSTSGTYTISASGFGFISEGLINSPVYGAVGANGVFVGSSTEAGVYDLFIAAPVTSQGVSTLQGSYSLAYMDPSGYVSQGIPNDALLQMTSNGSGSIGTVNLTGYVTSSTPINQSLSGVKYIVSNNAYVVTFPNSSSAFISGQEYLYSTPDGSFVFGGSPVNFDMIVGVRTGTSVPGLGAGSLYYQAGMDADNSQVSATGSSGFDTYYGSFFTVDSSTLLGHQRIQSGAGSAQGYTYSNGYQSGNYTDSLFAAQEIFGPGGVRIGFGIGPYPSLSVAVPAPALTSNSGVYLSPIGVVNAASSAPFTAGVSRGELITLYGANLGPSAIQFASTVPFPTTLAGVQVLINGRQAPIYYVSSGQVSVIVPYETSASIAQIQVVNNQGSSNVVTELVNATTPGIFTNPAGGIGYAAAEHADGSLVSPSHPAQVGEQIAVYVTGLGDVFPGIADGAPGVSSATSNTITAAVDNIAATVAYSGLAPTLVGLYQVNVTIPSGVAAGDWFLDISGPDSYTSEAIISVGSGGLAAPEGNARSNVVEHRKPARAFRPIHRGVSVIPQQ